MNNHLKQYLITDPTYYSNNPGLFRKNLKRIINKNKIDIACFRDKTSTNFEELANVFVKVCKELNIKTILINGNYKLAKELGATGVHLTSTQFNKIKEAKELDLFVIISCHNFDDIEKAQKYYVDAVTYSPIYHSPNKGEPKGINNLRNLISLYDDIDIIALGGIISEEQIEQVSKANAYGFASIRYFI